MNNIETITTLKLVPITNKVTQDDNEDSWLDNDNVAIIDNDFVAEDSGLTQAIEDISDANSVATKTLPIIEISHRQNQYYIKTDQGEMQCIDGVKIRINSIAYTVSITKIQPHASAVEPQKVAASSYDDIWGMATTATPQAQQQNHFADPFTTPVQPQQQQQDPLGFLAADPRQSQHNAPQQMHQNTMPFDQVPMMNSHMATLPQHDQLNINTGQAYAPANTMQQSQPSNYIEPNQAQGNILNDLGIDSSQSTITQRNYTQANSTFSEQSPMDMLDEIFDEEFSSNNMMMNQNNPMQQQFQQPITNKTTGLVSKLKNILK